MHGYPVIHKDERGAELKRLQDPGFPAALLRLEGQPSGACLGFIDPYGDTVFNQLQLDQLIREIHALRSSITPSDLQRATDHLLSFLRSCTDEMHTYVWIIGD